MASTANNSNNNNNNKKRKHYLPHNKAAKKKGAYPLHPGVQGFFITCDGGRERQASHEAIDVIESFYEELLHGSKPTVTRLAVVPEKPLNKKIKFTYDSDDEGGEGTKLKACTENDAKEKSTGEKEGPSNGDNECHESKSEVAKVDDKEAEDKSKEASVVDEPLVTGDDKEETETKVKQVKTQCLVKDAPEKEELSIDKQIEAELKDLGDRSKRRFVYLDAGCNGLVFVQMHKKDGDVSPKAIAQHMMTSISATKKHVSRFILRLLPIEVSCYASEEEISKAIQPLVTQYFPIKTETPRKFAVLYEARANSGVDRMKIIDAVAKCIPAPHKVDLTDPDMTIVVEIIKTVCLIGVVEKYKELSKYNLRQLSSSELTK